MASGPEAESSSHDEGLTELVRRIQIGDQTAIQAFHSMFSPGIEFLLQAAVHEIEAASPDQTINLSHLVTRTIQKSCASIKHGVEPRTADETMDSMANSVLAERTPLEQDILRRYYVLGESPEEIKTHLAVSSRTVQQTIAHTRAAFRRKMQRSESA